jgi:uncharacterized OsmC-like protein
MTSNPTVTLTQQSGYQFLIDFGLGTPDLLVDEPAPLGSGAGPTPSRLLVAGIANCLSFSLLTALMKFKQDTGGLVVTATAHTERNAEGRIRITEVSIAIRFGKTVTEIEHLERILGSFEAFSTVSQSVQQGIALKISVEDSKGLCLKG